MKQMLDLFSGEGGASQAMQDDPDWNVVTVDVEEKFDPERQVDVLALTHNDFTTEFDLVWASPPCTAFSMAATRTHIGEDGHPITDWGRTSIELVHHTRGLIKALNPEWWFIENPMGGLRRELGQPDAHVWWCKYGADRAKPADLWGRIPPSFDVRRCFNGNDDCHHEPAPRGSDTGTQGVSGSAERARIPYELSKAVKDAVERPGRDPQRNLAEVV